MEIVPLNNGTIPSEREVIEECHSILEHNILQQLWQPTLTLESKKSTINDNEGPWQRMHEELV